MEGLELENKRERCMAMVRARAARAARTSRKTIRSGKKNSLSRHREAGAGSEGDGRGATGGTKATNNSPWRYVHTSLNSLNNRVVLFTIQVLAQRPFFSFTGPLISHFLFFFETVVRSGGSERTDHIFTLFKFSEGCNVASNISTAQWLTLEYEN